MCFNDIRGSQQCGASMIEEAWNEYRGWAKRARTLQISSHRWSRVAFFCAGLAAILGAAASQVPDGSISGRTLAFLAAVVAAVTPILGREILSVDSEARWIRARATAEAIKAECFRFAAQLGDYAGSSARAAFIARRNTLSEQAERAGVTPLPDPVPSSGDPRRPPFPLTMPWYIDTASTSRCATMRMGRPKMKKVSGDIASPALLRP